MFSSFVNKITHPINDITTDINNPLTYIVPTYNRSIEQMNTFKNGKQQSIQHSDVKFIVIPNDISYDNVYQNIIQHIHNNKYEIVQEDKQQYKVQCIDTTPLMRFKDDIVIQIRQSDNSIQMRSRSRIGKSDMGKNAARIKHFLTTLKLK